MLSESKEQWVWMHDWVTKAYDYDYLLLLKPPIDVLANTSSETRSSADVALAVYYKIPCLAGH